MYRLFESRASRERTRSQSHQTFMNWKLRAAVNEMKERHTDKQRTTTNRTEKQKKNEMPSTEQLKQVKVFVSSAAIAAIHKTPKKRRRREKSRTLHIDTRTEKRTNICWMKWAHGLFAGVESFAGAFFVSFSLVSVFTDSVCALCVRSRARWCAVSSLVYLCNATTLNALPWYIV